MKQGLVLLFFFFVVMVASYVGSDWMRKQAYLVYSRLYVFEVNELSVSWQSQSNYPHGRNWLYSFYFQRRWEHLQEWGKRLGVLNRHLHLQGDFLATLEKISQKSLDLRDEAKVKFVVLELNDHLKHLPGSSLKGESPFLSLFGGRFPILAALVAENRAMVTKVNPLLPQLEVIFQAQFEADANTYCSTHKTMEDREAILAQMKQRCLDPSFGNLPMCQQGANYFQNELAQLQKLDQWNVGKLKQRWPQWREPACSQ